MKSLTHSKSATFAKNGSGSKKNPFRPWCPWREPFSKPNSATAGPATPTIIFSNQKRSPSRPWRPWREPSAFSLTEVVIAMGVATVAFTSIISLFPVGLNMSKESYEASQAALIAQTILADVKDEQTGTGNLRISSAPYNWKLIQTNQNSDPIAVRINYTNVSIQTVTPQTVYLAYKTYSGPGNDTDPNNPVMIRPSTGLLATNPPNWFTSGSNGVFAMVKITFSPTCRIGSATSTSSPMRVDVSVETPGTATAANRTCYLFTGAVR